MNGNNNNNPVSAILICLVVGVILTWVMPVVRRGKIPAGNSVVGSVSGMPNTKTNQASGEELLLVLERIQASRARATHPAEQQIWADVERAFVATHWTALEGARSRATKLLQAYTNQMPTNLPAKP